MSILLDGTGGVTTPGVVNTAGETIATTLSVTGATNLSALTTTGNTILGDASTDTLNVGNGGLVKDASGNVGIGTASPTKKLQVVSNTSQDGILISGSTSPRLQVIDTTNSVTLEMISSDSIATIRTDTNHDLSFATNGTERMRIDTSGYVFRAQSGQTSFISGQSSWQLRADSGAIQLSNTGTSSTSVATFYNANGAIGSISTSGSATTYSTSSDYRLKENIAPMTGALTTVSQLKPVTYSWKADGSDGQGFIAHELQAIVPDCVTGEKDAVDAEGNPVHQGVDTSFLVATLTAAIQEQQALIIQLQADVAALKALSA